MYPASDSAAIDLLNKLLTFNPNNRITLDQVMEHPFVARVRDIARETVADERQSFEWDSDPNMTIMKIRDHFLNLVRSF
jgi:mitogen-activated protein kinase 1/3